MLIPRVGINPPAEEQDASSLVLPTSARGLCCRPRESPLRWDKTLLPEAAAGGAAAGAKVGSPSPAGKCHFLGCLEPGTLASLMHSRGGFDTTLAPVGWMSHEPEQL